MKKIMNTFLLVFFISTVLAQKPCAIVNANAFYSVHLPGIMPVDENGLPRKVKPTMLRTIFLTSNCPLAPVISKISYDNIGTKFSIEKAATEEVSTLADNNGNKIIIAIPKGCFLWKISVIEQDNIAIPERPKTISILWKQKTKTNKFDIKKEVEIATPPSY
jgi:hypothetical protein